MAAMVGTGMPRKLCSARPAGKTAAGAGQVSPDLSVDLEVPVGRGASGLAVAEGRAVWTANLHDDLFEPLRASGLDRDARVRVVEGDTNAALAASDVALTASGTATVQAALHGTPMVIVRTEKAIAEYGFMPLMNM